MLDDVVNNDQSSQSQLVPIVLFWFVKKFDALFLDIHPAWKYPAVAILLAAFGLMFIDSAVYQSKTKSVFLVAANSMSVVTDYLADILNATILLLFYIDLTPIHGAKGSNIHFDKNFCVVCGF